MKILGAVIFMSSFERPLKTVKITCIQKPDFLYSNVWSGLRPTLLVIGS